MPSQNRLGPIKNWINVNIQHAWQNSVPIARGWSSMTYSWSGFLLCRGVVLLASIRPLRTHLTPGTGFPVILHRNVAFIPGRPTTTGFATSTSGLQAKSWDTTLDHILPAILSGSEQTVVDGDTRRFFFITRSRNFFSWQSHSQGLLWSDKYWKVFTSLKKSANWHLNTNMGFS